MLFKNTKCFIITISQQDQIKDPRINLRRPLSGFLQGEGFSFRKEMRIIIRSLNNSFHSLSTSPGLFKIHDPIQYTWTWRNTYWGGFHICSCDKDCNWKIVVIIGWFILKTVFLSRTKWFLWGHFFFSPKCWVLFVCIKESNLWTQSSSGVRVAGEPGIMDVHWRGGHGWMAHKLSGMLGRLLTDTIAGPWKGMSDFDSVV